MINKVLVNEVTKSNAGKIPIWLMRQAGRYLPEYMKEKSKHNSFLEMCFNSDSVAKITLQPLKRFALDAAIIFSDILIVPYAMGLELEFIKGSGPIFLEMNVIDRIDKIERCVDTTEVYNKVYEGIVKVKHAIDTDYKDKTLIGFAGSPFTVVCYVIQGMGDKDFSEVRKLYFNNKNMFLRVLNSIKKETIKYLKGQINSGVEVIKLFDSWAGILGEDEFDELVIKPTQEIILALREYKKDIIINTFPKGAGVKYKKFVDCVDTDIISIDSTVPKLWARDNLQRDATISGNLDNAILTAENSDIKKEAEKILEIFSKGRFIFNLGHGVLPNSKVEKVEELIKIVNEYERKR
jgi:uroporphyrinogen decarboxylase